MAVMPRLLLALLMLLPLAGLAQQKTILCPSVAPGTAYEACTRQVCAIPTADTDIVLTDVAGKKTFERLSTVPPTGAMFACGVQPVKWTTRTGLGLSSTEPPPVPPAPAPILVAGIGDTLWWNAEPLAASYRVYQGSATGTYGGPLSVTATRYALAGLPPGTYYFSIGAVDASGTEIARSSEISFTQPAPSEPPPKVLTCTNPVVNGMQLTMSCALQ